MAGYSLRPLARKLSIPQAGKQALVDAPTGLLEDLGPLPAGLKAQTSFRSPPIQCSLVFCATTADLKRLLPRAQKALSGAGCIWLCWPKKSSPLAADIDREVVRERGLGAGLVDIKVCAVNHDWSALKFVIPVAVR